MSRDSQNRRPCSPQADVFVSAERLGGRPAIRSTTRFWHNSDGRPAKAIAVWCHGYGHHSRGGVVMRLASELGARGIAVVTFDCEGNGTSSGTRGLTLSFDRLSEQAAAALEFARDRLREDLGPAAAAAAPAFLVGESMGGALAVNTALEDQSLWSGVALVAPMCGIDPKLMPPAVLVAALRGVASCCPGLAAVPTADHLPHCFRCDADTLIPLARSDPMRYTGLTRLGTGLSMLGVMDRLHGRAPALRLPLFVLHGTADAVTAPAVSMAFWEACGSEDKTYVRLQGAWHVLWVDDYAVRVAALDALSAWITARAEGEDDGGPAARVVEAEAEDRAWIPGPRERPRPRDGAEAWWTVAPGSAAPGAPSVPLRATVTMRVVDGPPLPASWARAAAASAAAIAPADAAAGPKDDARVATTVSPRPVASR